MKYSNREGLVYFILDNIGNVKIGVTECSHSMARNSNIVVLNTVFNRIKQLQTGNANELTVYLIVRCKDRETMFMLEGMLHRKFNEFKKCGEWFEFEPVENYLCDLWNDTKIIYYRLLWDKLLYEFANILDKEAL